MGKNLDMFKQGFKLGVVFSKKVLKNIFFLATSLLFTIIYSLLSKVSGYGAGFYAIFLLFKTVLELSFTLFLFFYAYDIWNKKSICFVTYGKNVFLTMQKPLFWNVVLLAFLGLPIFVFMPFLIPVLVIPSYEGMKESIMYAFSLIRKFYLLFIGFALYFYLIILAYIISVISIASIFFGRGFVLDVGGIIPVAFISLISAFIGALLAFLQVYLHEKLEKELS